jgi:hypothetical protein
MMTNKGLRIEVTHTYTRETGEMHCMYKVLEDVFDPKGA